MQKASILGAIVAAMTLSALVGNHAVGRLQEMKPHAVPIDSFPRQIGEWKAEEDIPVDARIQGFLPSAKIVERQYVNADGQTVVCTLITASNILDIHNPNVCIPAQGWVLSDNKVTHLGKQAISSMLATRDDGKLNIRYWFVGDTAGTTPGSMTLTKVFAIRKLFTKEQASSLFVRLITPRDPKGDAAIEAFTAAIQPDLKVLAAK